MTVKDKRRRQQSLSGVVLVLVLAYGVPSAAQEPEIVVKLDRHEIYLGESVRYTVLLNKISEETAPELAESPSWKFNLVGKTVTNSISIINGVRSESRGPRYVYELTPTEAGNLVIPGPTVEVEGKRVQGKNLVLRVVAPAEQGLARLQLSAEPAVVYPTQAFRVRLELSIRELPGSASRRDPLTVQRRLPTLTVPWADDDALPAGIRPVEPWDRWLQSFAPSRRRGGVSINDLQGRRDLWSEFLGRDPFGDRFGERSETRIGFHPTPSREMDDDGEGGKAEYWRYVFDRRFVATEAGEYAFGPATLKGTFAARRSGSDLEGKAVYSLAPAIEVIVRQPPSEGRPPEYIGAIGSFRCGANIMPKEAKVGDPMTLSVWIRGEGSLAKAAAPKLQENQVITDRFKVYDATEDLQEDSRTFTYSVRPKSADVTEFPAVALAYFDADAGEYVTLRTDPLSVKITAAEQLRRDEIAVAAGATNRDSGVEVSEEGIFANVTDLKELRDETVHPDRWFLNLGGMAGLFLILVVARRHADRRAGDSGLKRRRQAAARARQRIRTISRQAAANPGKVVDGISQAFVGLVADASDSAETGLTSAGSIERLRDMQIDDGLVSRCGALLEQCDAIRYGAAPGALNEIVDQAQDLAESLIGELRKRKHLP